ncbi:MAG: hypothetical protein H0U42_03970 [Thermoleophilaceae bacterium]|nr:hypothetical protein [Thermoleophilaceae bacterium]
MSKKKELTPGGEPQQCGICRRTLLKGERPQPYVTRDRERHQVCELCRRNADRAGWMRETAEPGVGAPLARPDRRQSLFGRLRSRTDPELVTGDPELDSGPALPSADEDSPEEVWKAEYEEHISRSAGARVQEREREGPRDPRHVRAVPTDTDVRASHALEIFNQTEHARTVAGLCRTLGPPWVSALPLRDAPSEISIVVAWELSWYQFRVDLGDSRDPVLLFAKGEELDELDETLCHWNASAQADGSLVAGLPTE